MPPSRSLEPALATRAHATPGKAKVGELDDDPRGDVIATAAREQTADQHVGRFHVLVEHAARMHVSERLRNLQHDGQREATRVAVTLISVGVSFSSSAAEARRMPSQRFAIASVECS